MNYSKTLTQIMPRQNGTQAGKNAIVVAMGRAAAKGNQSLFDNPYKVGSEYAELWFDGFISVKN